MQSGPSSPPPLSIHFTTLWGGEGGEVTFGEQDEVESYSTFPRNNLERHNPPTVLGLHKLFSIFFLSCGQLLPPLNLSSDLIETFSIQSFFFFCKQPEAHEKTSPLGLLPTSIKPTSAGI